MGWTNLTRTHRFKITTSKGAAVDIGCGAKEGGGAIAVLRQKEWVNKDDKDSRQRERDRE